MTRDSRRHAFVLALVVVCSSGLSADRAPIQSTLPVPEGRGAISGVVLDAASGNPVSGTVVTLVMRITVPKAPTISGVSRQITDASGRFVFTRLPAASYTMTANRPGYFDGGYGRTWQLAGNRQISLTEGEWVQDATIKLWREIAISGTIHDEVGEPVVGAWVRALAEIPISGQRQWVSGPVTKTDDRGIYRLAGLTPGRWTVMVPSVQTAVPADASIYTLSSLTPELVAMIEAAGRTPTLRNDPAVALEDRHRLLLGSSVTPPPAAGGRLQVYPITYYPSARGVTDAVVVDTSYGDDRAGINIVLRPVPAYKVSGVVEGPPDMVKGVLLRLMAGGSEDLGSGNETATSLPDGDGSFTFLNVPTGTYTLVAGRSTPYYAYDPGRVRMGSMARPPGQTASVSARSVFSAPPGTMLRTDGQLGGAPFAGRTRLEVGNGDLANVIVHLERGATISGRIVTETTPGVPVSSGMPVMNVVALPASGEPSLGQPSSNLDRSAPSSVFRIEGVQPGEYLIRAGGGLVKSVVHQGRDHTYKPVDVSTGQDIAGVVVTMTDQPAQLAGTVRDPQGRPVTSSAVAICFPAERDQWSRYGIQPVRLRSVTVADDGGFRFTFLPAGDYLVIAVDDGYANAWTDPAFLEKVAASATKVTIGWGETKNQSLTLIPVQ